LESNLATKKTIPGSFSVKSDMIKTAQEQASLGRMSIHKSLEGPLSGTSKGEMLTAMNQLKSSAGHIAVKRCEGEPEGKKGSFILQHFGIMRGGNESLILEVVPD
jgi:hypothetical protein